MNRATLSSLLEKLLLFTGVVAIGIAVFAYELGIDNNSEWGKSRLFLFVFGLCLGFALVFRHFHSQISNQFIKISNWWVELPIIQRMRRIFQQWGKRWGESSIRNTIYGTFEAIQNRVNQFPIIRYFQSSNIRLAILMTLLLVPIVGCIQFWLVTGGEWTFWEGETTYSDKLARAFLEGQTHLLESPPEELVQLPNPYDLESRKGMHYIWDSSLYQGKYYLYWGPVPALLAAIVKFVVPQSISDGQIVFVFLVGLLIIGSLLTIFIYKRWFFTLPGVLVIPAILLLGLSNPIPYLLTRPSVYEAAISGGQFFFMMALFWSFTSFSENQVNIPGLMLAGFSGALAVGCRTVLVIPVAGLTIMILWLVIQRSKKSDGNTPTAGFIFYLFPLVVGAAGLAWYNLIRFGSIVETGHRFQLSNIFASNTPPQDFSVRYILPNLYNYLLRPPDITPNEFPFIHAPYLNESDWPFFIRLPEFYQFQEPTASIWLVVPFLIFAIIPPIILLRRVTYKKFPSECRGKMDHFLDDRDRMWWVSTLILIITVTFMADILYGFSSMRYQADFLPALIMLGIFGFWLGAVKLASKPGLRKWFVFMGILLGILSAGIGLWMGLTGKSSQLEQINPQLYYQIRE